MGYFGSLLTAAVTPFDQDLTVNHFEFRKLLRALVENGSDGVVVSGTTGAEAVPPAGKPWDGWRPEPLPLLY